MGKSQGKALPRWVLASVKHEAQLRFESPDKGHKLNGWRTATKPGSGWKHATTRCVRCDRIGTVAIAPDGTATIGGDIFGRICPKSKTAKRRLKRFISKAIAKGVRR